MNLIKEYNELMGVSAPIFATQIELDEIGQLLDEMERVEAYMDASKCTRDEYADCEAERLSLCDRLDVLLERV